MAETCPLRRGMAFLFPGQGGVPTASPGTAFRRHGVREAYQALAGPGLPDFDAFHQAAVTDDRQAQMGSFALSMALLAVLRERGVFPDIVAGYSCGVYGGLVAAGMCTAATGLAIVDHAADRIEAAAPGHGHGMAAVMGLAADRVAALLPDLPGPAWIALVNTPTQILVGFEAGCRASLRRACLGAGAMKVVDLPFTKPYHAPQLAGAAAGLAGYLGGLDLDEPTLPMVLGPRPRCVGQATEAVRAVSRQLCRTVDWHAAVQRLLEAGVDTFVSLDPSRVLGRMVRWITRAVPLYDLGDDRDLDALFAAFPAPVAAFAAGSAARADRPAP